MGFIQGIESCFNIQKNAINVIYHINKQEKKWSSQQKLKQHLTQFSTYSWFFFILSKLGREFDKEYLQATYT